MNVKELRKALEKLPDDLPVVFEVVNDPEPFVNVELTGVYAELQEPHQSLRLCIAVGDSDEDEDEEDDEAKPHVVWILWGTSYSDESLSRYAFATLAELNAFLEGVSEADGWSTWQQFDEEQAAREFLEDVRSELDPDDIDSDE